MEPHIAAVRLVDHVDSSDHRLRTRTLGCYTALYGGSIELIGQLLDERLAFTRLLELEDERPRRT